jgi:DNA-binding MarR family transcriptional regulator
MSEAPLTPYAGTSGWSGSDTSRERVERDDADGTTAKRQREVLGNLAVMGAEGCTVKDIRDITGMHHGQASSTLSVLHKEGRLARLKQRRDRCQVYVLPEHVGDRETEDHGRKKPAPTESEQYALDHLAAKLAISEGLGIGMTTVRTHEIKVALDYLRRTRG